MRNFGKYPEAAELVKDLSDEDIDNLNRGGHDPYKVFAAYAEAMKAKVNQQLFLRKLLKVTVCLKKLKR